MKFVFASKSRLKTKPQFDQVFRNAKKKSGNRFALLFQPNNLDFPRLGIIISKRAVANASARNRLKRLIRESFRLQQHDIKNYDIIFLAYKGLDQVDNKEITANLEQIWPRKV